MKRIHFEIIESTNDTAKEYAINGESEGFVVTADLQTKGKGRLGRVWSSPKGNFFGSFIIEGINMSRNSELPFLVGISVIDALKFFDNDIECRCKWPNDIMLDGKKLCGILLEVATDNKIVAGIGINLQHHPSEGEVSYPATSVLSSRHKFITTDEMCVALSNALKENLNIWKNEGFYKIRRKWLECAYKINEKIKIKQLDKTFEGIFRTIDDNGYLILEGDNNEKIKINAGDVLYGKL
ncbi:MAG: Bifunctional ligase/repressor BirA [Alphaproteobacteria bacterium ADurb.Bin438]|nr:MAG: Bifunctional ligase/repressor BirA [Alphaproteobacteria bacterium ADurb.Bin438]